MRTTLLRLAVALATFLLGVAFATAWLGLFGSKDAPAHQKRESCRFRFRERPAPAPVAPLPPAPPALETLKAETCEGAARGRTVSGGVLNGKAISKPVPAYPAVGKAARASGTVVVEITVDECGDVESARAVSGHPLLRQAAVEAARDARFAPTRLSGEPVKVTGTISYNFVLQ